MTFGYEGLPIQDHDRPSILAHPFPHTDPPCPRNQWLGRRHPQVVAVFLQSFPHLDHIPVALGR
jgi:hypothetical protein